MKYVQAQNKKFMMSMQPTHCFVLMYMKYILLCELLCEYFNVRFSPSRKDKLLMQGTLLESKIISYLGEIN